MALNLEEQQDLINATQIALKSKKHLYELGTEDFPLGSFFNRITAAKNQLEGGLGFVVLRNLPVEKFEDDGAKVMLWCHGKFFGFPEPQDKAGALIHTVTDTGAAIEKTDNIRGFQTSEELQFHTDGGDVFALMCLRAAKRGGLSKLVSSVAIFNAIKKIRPDLAEILQEPFYFDTRAQNVNESQYQKVPIFIKHDNLISALYKRKYIETAQRFSDVPKLTDKQIDVLNLVDTLCNNKEFCFDMQLRAGDLEIANNATTFHSRENYEDHPELEKRRCMLRLWLSLFNGRALPDAYEATREWGPTFLRRKEKQHYFYS